jgi:hypothetical protein
LYVTVTAEVIGTFVAPLTGAVDTTLGGVRSVGGLGAATADVGTVNAANDATATTDTNHLFTRAPRL